MSVLFLLAPAIIVLIAGYLFYSRYLARLLNLGSLQKTPAHERRDDVDYVPAKMPVLLGHHFASIAGAAPIIGPVLAAQYGWLPVYLWIVFGGVFIGAVHDFTALTASVRHGGMSIGTIIETYLGRKGKLLFLLFAWAALILVTAVFTRAVASTFAARGETATSSLFFIALALLFGVAVHRFKVPLWAASIVGGVMLLCCLYCGYFLPFPRIWSVRGGTDPMVVFWTVIISVYVFIASVTPVHILLQPRDYLNSFLLYAMLGVSIAAIFVSAPVTRGPAVTTFSVEGLGPLFPMLFISVACGAVSGFHSMVASGTTAKQLYKETDARPVAYGGMLIESLLAVIALISVVYVSRNVYLARLFGGPGGADPVGAFSEGVSYMMVSLGFGRDFGRVFIALAVSAFALTSLDTAVRLARFTFQEIFSFSDAHSTREKTGPGGDVARFLSNRYAATAITVSAAVGLLLTGEGLNLIWQLFGAANQLLASLALMAVTIWLSRLRKKTWFTFVPMVMMYVVTVSALGWKLAGSLRDGGFLTASIAAALILLAFALAVEYIRSCIRNSEKT